MVQKIRRLRQAVAMPRPDWLPHPTVINLVGMLWAVAFLLHMLAPRV